MALIKSILSQHGVPAVYTKIHSMQIHYGLEESSRNIDVTVLSYASADARREGKQPLETNSYRFDLSVFGTDDPTRADIYKQLLTLPTWQDAEFGE